MILTNAQLHGVDGSEALGLNPDAMAEGQVPTLVEAAEFTLHLLKNITTDRFSKGGDKAARQALEAALKAHPIPRRYRVTWREINVCSAIIQADSWEQARINAYEAIHNDSSGLDPAPEFLEVVSDSIEVEPIPDDDN